MNLQRLKGARKLMLGTCFVALGVALSGGTAGAPIMDRAVLSAPRQQAAAPVHIATQSTVPLPSLATSDRTSVESPRARRASPARRAELTALGEPEIVALAVLPPPIPMVAATPVVVEMPASAPRVSVAPLPVRAAAEAASAPVRIPDTPLPRPALPDSPALALRVETPAAATIPVAPRRGGSPAHIEQLSRAHAQTRDFVQAQREFAAAKPVTLADTVAAMQVPRLPALAMDHAEREVLMTEAPAQLMVRVGDNSAGMVALRMTPDRQIEVQLAGLLDAIGDEMFDIDFMRLRNAAAAEAFVSLDTLRAAGLSVDYDAVYDELRIEG